MGYWSKLLIFFHWKTLPALFLLSMCYVMQSGRVGCARIFVNLCKMVAKWPKLRKKMYLKFDFSFLKKTNSKFENNVLLRGKATLPL